MDTSTQHSEWIEWAAHNLANGVSKTDVASELVNNGFDEPLANATISKIMSSPIYRAAHRIAEEKRKWTLLGEALVQLESTAYDPICVPRVNSLTSEEFLKNYYAVNRPVIITDVVTTWPALSKWTLAYLREKYGTGRIRYQHGRSATDHRESFVDYSVEDTMERYIDLVEKSGPTNEFYLIAHDRLLDREPFCRLKDDIIFDPRYLDANRSSEQVFFWLGPPGARTPMHRDLGNVYLAQILGRKHIRMIPSKQLHLVYNEVGYHSEVDFDDYSIDDFPLLKDANIMEVTVNPGELLFIPIGWWHCVKSIDITISVTGNNFRFANSFNPIF